MESTRSYTGTCIDTGIDTDTDIDATEISAMTLSTTLTVTPNPTIDRVLFVRDFAMQDVVRATREVVSPSGKGIDVALILHELGAPAHAIALNAGRHGALLAELVAATGLSVEWIPALGETRMATLLTDEGPEGVRRQSTILAHTLHAGPDHLAQLLASIDARAGDPAAPAWGLVTAGSLPPGLPLDAHAQILARAHAHGLVTLLDSSGPGLVAGVRALPHILKVNQAEFSALVAALGRDEEGKNGSDRDAPSAPDIFSFQEPLSAPSVGYEQTLRLAEQVEPYLGQLAREAIVITLGPAGILAVTTGGIYHAPALPVQVVSPAGAGDAVSAGMMLARSRGEDWTAALIWAAALAAAVVSSPGTAECSRDQVLALAEQATVIELDVVSSS